MSKKDKEIEILKKEIELVKKSNSETLERLFKNDFQNVIKTLEKYGSIEYTIDIDHTGSCVFGQRNITHTIVLKK